MRKSVGPEARHVGRFQRLEQAVAGVPGHVRRTAAHVVAGQRRHRQALHLVDTEAWRQLAVLIGDDAVNPLVVADQVHLVDRQQHVADAQQPTDIGMPPRLHQQALACIDQHHRQLGVGGAGGHVAGVLLVAGAIGHDEAAPRGVEIAVGHVDGDALLALGIQPVGEQGEVEHVRAGIGMQAAALARQRRQLIVRQHAGVVQQASEQGALAVVHAAAGDETQQSLLAEPVGSAVRWRTHQK